MFNLHFKDIIKIETQKIIFKLLMEYLLQDWSFAGFLNKTILGLVAVGVIWGVTNPFMEYG
jgi:hypothetical protein